MSGERFGLSVALATPFDGQGRIDGPRMAAHARACLDAGCVAVTLFGSTGEGPSLDARDRAAAVAALEGAGIGGERMILGVFGNAVGDVVARIAQAREVGARAILLAPPFYFSHPGEGGVIDWFSAVLAAAGENAPPAILYHIPVFTQVSVGAAVAGALAARFPGRVMGVKDSGGNWEFTARLLSERGDLDVLIGDERHLAPGMRQGCAGSISGMANLAPDRLLRVIEKGEADPALDAAVDAATRLPVIPAIKAAMAAHLGPGWERVRPPLEAIAPPPAPLLAAMGRIASLPA